MCASLIIHSYPVIWAVTGGLWGGVGAAGASTGATPLPRSVAEEVAMLLMLPEGLPPSASAPAASSQAGFVVVVVVVGSGRGAAAAAAVTAARVGVVLSGGGGLRREEG